ncbi:4'-phosphopantetheinyl transferase superfamily protein [Caulobacter sp. SLTY]|uniref:4'-phosphopantetheinyl transferase superfamily protein n=1 Tax=Caulobacter sp. SLTY TaxID=2683262 RepID=UPI001412C029|nr:4'-phosphopantetheinyl transferase superfamily protein [Caulobacter sp. SLTY]
MNRGWPTAAAPLPCRAFSSGSKTIADTAYLDPARIADALAAGRLVVGWRADGASGAARRLLADLLAPQGWPGDLAHDGLGAPVSPWLAERGVAVSLSSSGGMAACALLKDGWVGVDVEAVEAGVDMVGVADDRFDPACAAWIEGASADERPDRFFRSWTLLEAALKALGTGFLVEPAGLKLLPSGLAGGEPPGMAWSVAQPDCGPGWRLSAVALSAARPALMAGPVID